MKGTPILVYDESRYFSCLVFRYQWNFKRRTFSGVDTRFLILLTDRRSSVILETRIDVVSSRSFLSFWASQSPVDFQVLELSLYFSSRYLSTNPLTRERVERKWKQRRRKSWVPSLYQKIVLLSGLHTTLTTRYNHPLYKGTEYLRDETS